MVAIHNTSDVYFTTPGLVAEWAVPAIDEDEDEEGGGANADAAAATATATATATAVEGDDGSGGKRGGVRSSVTRVGVPWMQMAVTSIGSNQRGSAATPSEVLVVVMTGMTGGSAVTGSSSSSSSGSSSGGGKGGGSRIFSFESLLPYHVHTSDMQVRASPRSSS